MGNFQGVVQYNDEDGNPIDINYICNMMTNSSWSPLQAYAAVSNLFLRIQGVRN